MVDKVNLIFQAANSLHQLRNRAFKLIAPPFKRALANHPIRGVLRHLPAVRGRGEATQILHTAPGSCSDNSGGTSHALEDISHSNTLHPLHVLLAAVEKYLVAVARFISNRTNRLLGGHPLSLLRDLTIQNDGDNRAN